jgi:hypothetical protein
MGERIAVYCDDCGSVLSITDRDVNPTDGGTLIHVSPCEVCLDERARTVEDRAKEEGFEAGKRGGWT